MKSVRHKLTVVARAVIVQRGRVLAVNNIGHRWYFFPGGHVQTRETIRQALVRELREELGVRLQTSTFLGAFDNRFYNSPTEQHQEIGLLFAATVRGTAKVREKHLAMRWIPIRRLGRTKMFPAGVAPAVTRALKTRRPFWLVEDSTKKR